MGFSKSKVEETIRNTILYLSDLILYKMELTGDYEGWGKEEVLESYCRSVLNLPADQPISKRDRTFFRALIVSRRMDNEILSCKPEELQERIVNCSFDFGEEKVPVYEDDIVNRILEAAGSSKRLISGYNGNSLGIIFGEIITKKIDGFAIPIIISENARTPNRVLSQSAIIRDNQIYIRQESLENVFYERWVRLMEHGIETTLGDARNIFDCLNKKYLELHQIKDQADLLNKKETILNEQILAVYTHEMGHRHSKKLLSPEEFALGLALDTLELEIFADFAPAHSLMALVFKMAKTDKNRASRILLNYIIDKWFYITQNEKLHAYADLIIPAIMKFWVRSGQFDFSELYDFLYTGENSFFNIQLKNYKDAIREARAQIESAEFKINNIRLDFKTLSSSLKELFKKNDGYIDEKSEAFIYAFWNQVVLQLKKNAPKSAEKLSQYLEKKQNKEQNLALCKSSGFFEIPKSMSFRNIFLLACKDLMLSPEQTEQAINKLDCLLEQEPLDLNSSELKRQDAFSFVMQRLHIKNPAETGGQLVVAW